MLDSALHSPICWLAFLYILLAIFTVSLLFSRPAALGGLPARIYVLNMAHGPLLMVSAIIGDANVTGRWWYLAAAVVACALAGAQLFVERWSRYRAA